jgi:Ca2+-binding EF-hand superfamily protein
MTGLVGRTQEYLQRRKDAKQDRKIRKIFDKTDKDNNGLLSLEELREYLASILKVTPGDEEMTDFISLYDKDGNEELDFDEFKSMMTRYNGLAAFKTPKLMNSREARVLEAFLEFDRDGDGFITCSEILSTLREIYGQDVEESEAVHMMEMADKNGDGVVDYEEFKLIIGKI